MKRLLPFLIVLMCVAGLAACGKTGDTEQAKKVEAPVVLKAPAGTDDKEWTSYLQQVVKQNMEGVTDSVSAYYLPVDSTTPTPGDLENKSKYDRQLENVSSVIARTVLPGNMLVFGSPDSATMANLIVAAFTGGKADALERSQVLFIGKSEDSQRVKAAVEALSGKLIFVEAK